MLHANGCGTDPGSTHIIGKLLGGRTVAHLAYLFIFLGRNIFIYAFTDLQKHAHFFVIHSSLKKDDLIGLDSIKSISSGWVMAASRLN